MPSTQGPFDQADGWGSQSWQNKLTGNANMAENMQRVQNLVVGAQQVRSFLEKAES